jgi:hypothetical protein
MSGYVLREPNTYRPDVVQAVLDLIAEGKSLRAIAAIDGMPTPANFIRWVNLDIDGLAERYAHARAVAWQVMADEVGDIADDGVNDKFMNADGKVVIDTDHINRSRLRVDTRKWLLSKMLPKVYGEKTSVDIKMDMSNATDAELAAVALGQK